MPRSRTSERVPAYEAGCQGEEQEAQEAQEEPVDEKLSSATTDGSPRITTLPPEILLTVLYGMEEKQDWLNLAKTCRRLADVVLHELYRYIQSQGDDYALWYACYHNNVDGFLRLVTQDGQTQNWINRHLGYNCLREDYLLYSLERDMTPLCVAVAHEGVEMVEMLLAHGADLEIPELTPRDVRPACWYPIHYAVLRPTLKSKAILSSLLKAGANPDRVPLYRQEVTSTHLLSDRQPRVEALGESRGAQCAPIFRVLDLPAQTAFNIGNEEFQILLKAGADPAATHTWCNSRPAFYLLSRLDRLRSSTPMTDLTQHLDLITKHVILFLTTLREYVDISKLDAPGYSQPQFLGAHDGRKRTTLLHFACELDVENRNLIFWLIEENGISINALDEDGRTPLMSYFRSGVYTIDVLQDLVRSGANVQAQANDGTTALHELCKSQPVYGIVKSQALYILLQLGADPRVENAAGERPIQLLVDYPGSGTKAIEELLLARERELNVADGLSQDG
ncbi:ankyrin repeat-containing domain protein [Xylariaceae sp. FL0594]|nr:ankyrin repeat-containing domain protein [Xylariaceae sp. FL0594]